ncbi:MAG: SDR family NAD(P)-dependent oxidoreductase [Pseudomonadota bacterium]
MVPPLALVVGVGAATGASFCRSIGQDMRLAMVARSSSVITELAALLPAASAYHCDVTDEILWRNTLTSIVSEHGAPKVVLINTEGGAWGDYGQMPVDRFRHSFDVNVVSLLVMVQALFPDPQNIAPDTRVLISSSPAAFESTERFLGLAPSRAGQRVLAETLDTVLRPAGLSFGLVNINGPIDEPAMREIYGEQPAGFYINPDHIAAHMVELLTKEQMPLHSEIRPPIR